MSTQIIDFGLANARSIGQAQRHERRRRGQLTNRQQYEIEKKTELYRVKKQPLAEFGPPQFHIDGVLPPSWPKQQGNKANSPSFQVNSTCTKPTRAYSQATSRQRYRATQQAKGMPAEQAIRRRKTQEEWDKEVTWKATYTRLEAEARQHADMIRFMTYAEGLEAGWEYPARCYKDYNPELDSEKETIKPVYMSEVDLEEDYYPDDY